MKRPHGEIAAWDSAEDRASLIPIWIWIASAVFLTLGFVGLVVLIEGRAY